MCASESGSTSVGHAAAQIRGNVCHCAKLELLKATGVCLKPELGLSFAVDYGANQLLRDQMEENYLTMSYYRNNSQEGVL